MEDEYKMAIDYSFSTAEEGISDINQQIINIDGLCVLKMRHLFILKMIGIKNM